MTEPTLALVHTVAPLLEVFSRLGTQILPGVRLLHILDEPLRERFYARGLMPDDTARLLSHVRVAEEVGARAVLVTCSTLSLAVDEVRLQASVPIFKIDEQMVAQAVAMGSHIGVLATARSTLEPTRALFLTQAAKAGREIALEMVLVEGALDALFAGDGAQHDRLVREAALALAPRVDVIALAQASMARVLDVLPATECPVPVLSSPRTALEQVRAYLAAHGFLDRSPA